MRTLGFAFLFGSTLNACATDAGTVPGDDELAGENGQDGDAPKADDPYNNYGLYEARKIGAFECNGAGSCTHIELNRANRSTMTCADGTSHATCTARTMDFAKMNLASDQLDRAMTALQAQAGDPSLGTQLLVRGTFVHGTNPQAPGVDWVTFQATEVWVAQLPSGSTDGTFVRVNDSNIRCITAPCPSLHEGRLNSSRGMNIEGLDFGGGASDDLQGAVYAGVETADGAIVVGNRTYGAHQGTADKLRSVEQVYLRLK